MDIVQHISELLFEHDCVMIHGFGGFVANYQSAKIHPVQHTFSPPVKNILFNKDLRNNDGLLANRIVSHEHISYTLALEEINTFATNCLKKIYNGETVELEGIGQLYPDSEGNIQFKQWSKVNFLKETYGMSSFISPAIQRRPTRKTQEIRPNFADRQKSKNQKIGATILLKIAASVAVLAILSFAGYNYFNPPTHGINESSIIPPIDQYVNYNANNSGDFQNNKPELNGEIVPQHNDEIVTSNIIKAGITLPNNTGTIANTGSSGKSAGNNELMEAEAITTTPPRSEETAIETTTALDENIPETIIRGDPQKPNQKMYHLIAGSFKDTENATALIDLYQQRGYEPQIIDPAQSGYYRVSICAYLRKSEALVELHKARDLYNPNIWLLRH